MVVVAIVAVAAVGGAVVLLKKDTTDGDNVVTDMLEREVNIGSVVKEIVSSRPVR
jgi:hypothetical protein